MSQSIQKTEEMVKFLPTSNKWRMTLAAGVGWVILILSQHSLWGACLAMLVFVLAATFAILWGWETCDDLREMRRNRDRLSNRRRR